MAAAKPPAIAAIDGGSAWGSGCGASWGLGLGWPRGEMRRAPSCAPPPPLGAGMRCEMGEMGGCAVGSALHASEEPLLMAAAAEAERARPAAECECEWAEWARSLGSGGVRGGSRAASSLALVGDEPRPRCTW